MAGSGCSSARAKPSKARKASVVAMFACSEGLQMLGPLHGGKRLAARFQRFLIRDNGLHHFGKRRRMHQTPGLLQGI